MQGRINEEKSNGIMQNDSIFEIIYYADLSTKNTVNVHSNRYF